MRGRFRELRRRLARRHRPHSASQRRWRRLFWKQPGKETGIDYLGWRQSDTEQVLRIYAKPINGCREQCTLTEVFAGRRSPDSKARRSSNGFSRRCGSFCTHNDDGCMTLRMASLMIAFRMPKKPGPRKSFTVSLGQRLTGMPDGVANSPSRNWAMQILQQTKCGPFTLSGRLLIHGGNFPVRTLISFGTT
jgi:hypothetical protein